MKSAAPALILLIGPLLLWIAVGFVLVYDHNVTWSNPALTIAERESREHALWLIAAVFLLFNAAMTFLRYKQLTRSRPPSSSAGPTLPRR